MLVDNDVQIEDLSQQAQMAAAEKFRAPEQQQQQQQQATVAGETPSAAVHESDDEEVNDYLLIRLVRWRGGQHVAPSL